jgi:hypothetical protein
MPPSIGSEAINASSSVLALGALTKIARGNRRRLGNLPAGSVIRVGSRFIIVMTDGAVAMAEPQDDGWTIRGEFVLPRVSAIRKANSNIRVCTHPVVANGKLYVRDQELLYCHDLRKPAR